MRTPFLQIENDEERQEPARDAELHEAVGQEHAGGASALHVHDGELQVVDDARQHKHRGAVEEGAVDAEHHFLADGVHDVAHHRDGGDDGDGLVHKGEVVAVDVAARLDARVLVYHHVVSPLGKGQKERQQKRHQYNPVGQVYACSHAAHHDAQHKAGGDDKDVDHGDALQPHAIGDVHHVVESQQRPHAATASRRQQEHGGARQKQHCGHQRVARSHRHGTAGYGPQPLLGMQAVGLAVVDVVEAIDGTGGKAVGRKRRHAGQQAVGLKHPPVEKQRQEDEEILHPLVGAEKEEEVLHHRGMRFRLIW